jgi:large conductance mechanosensitive channel
MIRDFREFLFKTNALALAVGVIIGGAVGKVVSSIVSDLLMPVVGLVVPGGTWRDIRIVLTHAADGTPAAAIMLGSFLGAVVDFVIVGFVVFLITKAFLKPAPAPPSAPVKTCNECKETIPADARKCKFCASPV